MKIYLDTNVYEESLKRIERIFDIFDNVVVAFSGGKDSTVCLELTIEVARKLNKLPVNVMFLDQEAEWTEAIDYIRRTSQRPEVKMYWMQFPFRLSNATSETNDWLWCWKEGEKWIREKEPIALTENVYGTTRFKALFARMLDYHFGENSACIGGVRSEESPGRHLSLTTVAKVEEITWAKANNKNKRQFTVYPIYDWSFKDVWSAIAKNNWDYCAIYDKMYQKGVATQNMRVSNLHHETAVTALDILQEVDRDLWQKLTERLEGINTYKHVSSMYRPSELPYMFKDWVEYRDYLLEKLITNEQHKATFKRYFEKLDLEYTHPAIRRKMAMECVGAILVNDHWSVKIDNFVVRQETGIYRKWKRGLLKATDRIVRSNVFVQDALKYEAENG